MRSPAALPLVLSLTLTACDARQRPGLLEPNVRAELEVEVLSPSSDAVFIAGRTLVATVRAREPNGLITGVGVVARTPTGELVDSLASSFAATAPEVTRSFFIPLPDTLSAQVSIVGLAFGPNGAIARTDRGSTVNVVQCAPNASWC